MRLVLCSLIFAHAVFSAPLSLKNAYQSALTKNETVLIKETDVKAADERVSQAFGRILPTVSFIGSYGRQDAGSGLISSQNNGDQWNARANVTQPIFRGLSEFAAYRGLKAKSRSQTALQKQTRLNLYSQTTSVYYDLLLAQTDLLTVKILSDLTAERVKDIRARTKIGRSKKGDRLSAEAQALSLAAQMEEAKATLRQAEENFLLTTGITGPYNLETPKELPELKTSITELLKSLENRPDIVSAKEEAIAADENVAVARGSHFPQIEAFGNYYFQRMGALRDVKWDLGVTLTFPLFAGGTIQSAVRESLETHKSAELSLSFARRNAEKEVRALGDTYLSTLSQYKALKEAAELSDLNYKEQNKDYRYGLVSNLEVLQAMNALQETKRSMDRTFYSALKTYAQLEAATGTSPFEKESK